MYEKKEEKSVWAHAAFQFQKLNAVIWNHSFLFLCSTFNLINIMQVANTVVFFAHQYCNVIL